MKYVVFARLSVIHAATTFDKLRYPNYAVDPQPISTTTGKNATMAARRRKRSSCRSRPGRASASLISKFKVSKTLFNLPYKKVCNTSNPVTRRSLGKSSPVDSRSRAHLVRPHPRPPFPIFLPLQHLAAALPRILHEPNLPQGIAFNPTCISVCSVHTKLRLPFRDLPPFNSQNNSFPNRML